MSMNTEALKRKLSDALAAYQQDDLMHLDGLVDEIEALGPSYGFHATLLRSALKKKDQAGGRRRRGVDPGARQARARHDVDSKTPPAC